MAKFWIKTLKDCRSGFIAVLIFSLITLGLEHLGWLNTLKGVDAMFQGQAQNVSSDIVIVEIKEKDYVATFKGKSPLAANDVMRLIQAVDSARPSVIGVDLDTSTGPYVTPDFHSKVVWAQVPRIGQQESGNRIWRLLREAAGYEEVPELTLQPVLDGAEPPSREMTGIPLFQVDPDGVVRRYRHEFGKMDSLARAVLKHAPGNPGPASEEELLFNFAGDRYSFPIFSAGDFLDNPSEQLKKRLENKIVLIGGNFAEARDEYLTPLGSMAGVELIAQAIQSDRLGGIREMPGWAGFLLDLAFGFTMVMVLHFRSPRQALWLSVAAFPVVFYFSMLTFRAGNRFLNFVPILFGAFLHKVYESGEAAGEEEVRHELTLARRRIRKLEKQLKQDVDAEETEP